jgi:3-hydroxyisobutyrate dehydrogenase
MTEQIAFLGLGVMGYPMAGHLARAGHKLCVYNRSPAKAAAWAAEFGGSTASSPAAATASAQMVFACVGGDPDLREICLGRAGAFDAMPEGAVFFDHTTSSAALARELAAEAETRRLHFLDAPISGGQQGAQSGQLSVMAGGDAASFARARPFIDCYAKAVSLMGVSGAGQLTKMVNQIAVVGVMQGLAEAIAFGQHAGLDIGKVLEVLSNGAASSWQMQNRGPTMAEGRFDFGFAVDWMRKDLRICLEEAARNGSTLEITGRIAQFYDELAEAGGGRKDASSLIERLRTPN